MKRILLFALALGMVLSFALAVPVQAVSSYADWEDPYVVPSGPDAKVITESNLPGTVELNERFFPVWSTIGEVEYHGKGLTISGMNGKYTTAIFAFKQSLFGWEGKIYQWSGVKWVAVPTNIHVGFEDGPTYAYANVTDGTYALIA